MLYSTVLLCWKIHAQIFRCDPMHFEGEVFFESYVRMMPSNPPIYSPLQKAVSLGSIVVRLYHYVIVGNNFLTWLMEMRVWCQSWWCRGKGWQENDQFGAYRDLLVRTEMADFEPALHVESAETYFSLLSCLQIKDVRFVISIGIHQEFVHCFYSSYDG